jgi:hypothetical protein
MVHDDYTNKEDAVVDEEAIQFNDRDNNGDGNNEGDNSSDDNNNDGDDYIEAVATMEKKRKKGNCQRQGSGISPRGRQTHQSTMIL